MNRLAANRTALQGLVRAGIIGFSIAVGGGIAWKINVHDKKMKEIDNFYMKNTSATAAAPQDPSAP